MTLIVGNVVDVGLGGLDGALRVWAWFRPEDVGLVAPYRREWPIVEGQIAEGVDVMPGPTVIEVDCGMNAFTTFEVIVPDQAQVTIQDLYLQAYPWEPWIVEQIAQYVIDAQAALAEVLAAADDVEAAIAGAADQVLANVAADVARAEAARAGAEDARDTATGMAGTATTKADEAAGSAATASDMASAAAASSAQALTHRDTAAGHADTATSKASEAAGSASTATTKAGEASASAVEARGYRDTAEGHASDAAGSASTAATHAQTAEADRNEVRWIRDTEVIPARDAAAGHAQTAGTKADEAADSAATASTKAGEASAAAATATDKAGEASSSASAAAASESSAAGSASAAEASAGAAAGSASTAATEADRATVEADRSRDEADRSKTEADRAQVAADNAEHGAPAGGWTKAELEQSVQDTLDAVAGKADVGHKHPVSDIQATGTRSGTTYLAGDGTFKTPPNTTYSAMPVAEAETGTATGAKVVSAATLKAAILKHSPPTDISGKADVGHKHVWSDITNAPAYSKETTGDALVQRTANGNVIVPADADAMGAVRRQYVDSGLAGKVGSARGTIDAWYGTEGEYNALAPAVKNAAGFIAVIWD